MTWLVFAALLAVVAVLGWLVNQQIRLARRLGEFLRNEDLEHRNILKELIRVLTEQAKRNGFIELEPKLIGFQKEVNELARLFADINSKLLANPNHGPFDSGLCCPLAKLAEEQQFHRGDVEIPTGKQQGTVFGSTRDCTRVHSSDSTDARIE